MAVTIDSADLARLRQARFGRRKFARRPANRAAARAARAGLALGFLGLASCRLVVLRLGQSWRVEPHLSGHQVSILGARLSYPTANVWALLIVALALLGLLVVVLAAGGGARELSSSRRFGRELARHSVGAYGGAVVVDDQRPVAFCAGLLRPRAFVSSAAVRLLDGAALEAVLAHELHHVRRRDPLRAALNRVLARALFFVPGLGELSRRQVALAELSADETAIAENSSNRSALARAMLGFEGVGGAGAGVDPARVDFLLGEAPSWRFPSLVCVGAAAMIGLLAALAMLLGDVASGSATLAPPFLSQQPCVVALALIPALLWLSGLAVRRALMTHV